MILVDKALRKRQDEGQPIKIGILGTGATVHHLVAHITRQVPGIEVVAIASCSLPKVIQAPTIVGGSTFEPVATLEGLDSTIARGKSIITDNPGLLSRSACIDCVVEMTSLASDAAALALDAITHSKPLVLTNCELDATIGPILHQLAKQSGCRLTSCDGDRPGATINLRRFVEGLGLVPRVLGIVSNLPENDRKPGAVEGLRNGNPAQQLTVGDETKANFQQCIVANASGFTVTCRGMSKRVHRGHIDALASAYDLDELRELGGVVDYVIGAKPASGVFCLAEMPDKRHVQYLDLYKLGKGPLYSFYRPYHLSYLEVPMSVGRLVCFGDSVVQTTNRPMLEVVAMANRDMRTGEILDSSDSSMTYGHVEKVGIVRANNLLPKGLARGCILLADIPRGEAIRRDLIQPPVNQLVHRLYDEQTAHFRAN